MEQKLTQEQEKKFDNRGYVLIFIDRTWKREHIVIMENYIGRKLTKDEIVHHDNFIKNDNRCPENLTLFPNNKAHSHFHRQIKQFSYTNPRKLEILYLKEFMEQERSKNE